MKATAVNEVTLAIIAAIDAAVAYTVYDGPPSKLPTRTQTQYLVVGADTLTDQSSPATAAVMDQVWMGLGEKARDETLQIHCVAAGHADSIANARALAMAVIGDVGNSIPQHPTPESYNALIAVVSAVHPHNVAGGAIVHIEFTITAKARLT